MRVLRAKSDSLNAMLEAFVHDPLIGWKLLHAADAPDAAAAAADAAAGGNSDNDGDDDSDDDKGSAVIGASVPRGRRDSADGERGRSAGERRRSKSQQFGPRAGTGADAAAAEDGAAGGNAASSSSSSSSPPSGGDVEAPQRPRSAGGSDEAASKLSALLHVSTIEVNEQAMRVTRRIQLKLDGREFADEGDCSSNSRPSSSGGNGSGSNGSGGDGSSGGSGGAAAGVGEVPVEEQVDRLIKQARAHENLAQMFVGWCGFW
jgi:phosphatidylinositol kinase/protein kinase (PI-3  family)